jgi:hypothetical protein
MDNNYTKLNSLFAEISPYIYWEFSDFLNEVLKYKQIDVATLYYLIEGSDYEIEKSNYEMVEIESFRRYFNSNMRVNRFPPKEFVKVFCRCLQLTDKQEEILLILHARLKVIRKLNKKMKEGKLSL